MSGTEAVPPPPRTPAPAPPQGTVAPPQGTVPPPAPPGAPLRILISPWQGTIDLSTKAGKSLWDEGITPLDNKFSGLGKDVVRFLADVKNRVDKCEWLEIISFGPNRDLINDHGKITKQEVINARDARDLATVTTLDEARPQINARMMFYFLYDSLGTVPQKKISTRLASIEQDGPLLLKLVLDDTFIATTAATFTIKENFYDLNLKRYKWNVELMNQDVSEKMVDLKAAGHESDQTDVIIALFRAYNTSTNEEFKQSCNFWKNEWKSGIWSKTDELMQRANEKYMELRRMGTWGKRANKDEQYVALNAKINELVKDKDSSGSKGGTGKEGEGKSNAPKWKFDRSLSTTNTYERNEKKYHWCDGPGHKPMWVIHDPGSCTKGSNNNNNNNNQSQTFFSKKALTAALKNKGDMSDDEIQGKVEAILSIFED